MRPASFALAMCAVVLLLAPGSASAQENAEKTSVTVESRAFWNPRIVPSDGSLFGALGEFGRLADENRVLRSRGLIRPFQFRYKNFSYERDFFHVYKGFRLRSFMDGKVDLGLYKHYLFRGLLFGPAGAYVPSGSNRFELTIRWNLNDR